MGDTILIGSMNGSVYTYDINTKELILHSKPDNKGIMGLALDEKYLFISSREVITRQEYPKGNNKLPLIRSFSNDRPEFHQLLLHEQKIYITCTAINEIWILDIDLTILSKHTIRPPLLTKPIRLKVNYNHVNSICHHNNLLYVGLNWFTSKQYGRSGVCVLDLNLKERHRFEYGWETHGFIFMKDKPYALCATSSRIDKKINHPRHSGLMVNDILVFEHPIDVFCKAFVVTENSIYLLGGDVAKRNDRKNIDGVMYVLDRNFNLLDTFRFDSTGQFCGGILL